MVVFRAQIIQAQSDMQSSSQKFAYNSSKSAVVKHGKLDLKLAVHLNCSKYKEVQIIIISISIYRIV